MKILKSKILFYLSLFINTVFSTELRNPFLPVKKTFLNSSNVSENFQESIILKAIVKSGEKTGAMLEKGFDKKLVFIDDKIWGYKVTQINSNEVSLLGEDGTSLLLG